jgi:hypothetical protein
VTCLGIGAGGEELVFAEGLAGICILLAAPSGKSGEGSAHASRAVKMGIDSLRCLCSVARVVPFDVGEQTSPGLG